MDSLLASILDGESLEDDKRTKTPEKLLAEKEARKISREHGLNDPASLDIFSTWYAFGGMQNGLSPVEVAAMPTWLRDDFRFLISELGYERKQRDSKKKADEPPTPKRRISRR